MRQAPKELFDDKKLAELRDPAAGGDGEFFAEISGIFMKEAPTTFRALRAAAEQGDCEKVKKLAHRLKGMSMNLGAHGLTSICSKMETMGLEQNISAIAQEIAHYEKVYTAIEKFLKDETSGK